MQRIVAVLVIVVGAGGSANCLGSVHTYAADFNLPIPKPDSKDPSISKGWMADAAIIKVPDHFIITDVDVGISLTHTNVFDLQISMRSPAGTTVYLNMYNYDEFFVGANYTGTIFDDEAISYIKEGKAPFTGRFRPFEPHKLSEFNGHNAYGYWHLRIYDAFYYDTGTFNRLELMITDRTPEPATVILLTFGVCLMRLRRRRPTF